MKYNQYKKIKLLKVLMFGKYRVLIFKEYDNGMLYTYYIQNIEYGTMLFVYGMLCKNTSLNNFIDIVKEDVKEYIVDYKEMFED